ncbi:hypothetical protein JCGZ_04272 [Jatropha curcas]|uniref:EF-hand domain-containing protein n=1 Tax=Jatropha curcas TaxID=180498 RepID=A0A067KQE8_JATCU|nr:hypothetical protein JCGZ_04272 [Jatropha curcas]
MTCQKNIDRRCLKPVPIFMPVGPSEEQIESCFRRFDTNGDGYLSIQELKNAYKALGRSFPLCRALRALYIADENRDGYISKKEFHRLFRTAYI